MQRHILAALAFLTVTILSVFIAGCDTTPPTDSGSQQAGEGYLIVNSDVDGAQIFLDGVFTGKVTPDTLKTSAGTHTVRVEKSGEAPAQATVDVAKNLYRSVQLIFTKKTVLLEDFANVSCVPCVTSNKILESLEHYTYNRKQLVAIKFPTNFPSPTDLFYTVAKPYSNARITYYTVMNAPAMIVNGTVKPSPGDSMKVKDAINQQLLQKAQFRLDVSAIKNGTDYSINVSVRCLDTAGIDFSKVVLHTAVIETPIEFATPPGSNGETKFYNVLRQMIPDYNGEPLGAMSIGQTKNFPRNITLGSGWNTANIYAVAFIQNPMSKVVYQTATTQQ